MRRSMRDTTLQYFQSYILKHSHSTLLYAHQFFGILSGDAISMLRNTSSSD